MKAFLSVCMIIKNEEKVLGRCLDSISGIADEIIIVDTGSQDISKEIALHYTDQVFDFKWVNDFSKARNYATSKAKGEWIFVIDADEYVERESFQNFKKDLKKNPPIQNILALQIVSFHGKDGGNTTLNYHERLYKNDGFISYYRNVHELLFHKESKEKRGIYDFQLYHSGYMKDVINEKDKSSRNLTLLLNNKEKAPIDYYFIGNEYNRLGESDKAIMYYQKAYNLKGNLGSDWVKKLLLNLVLLLHTTNKNDEALEIIDSCEKIYNNIADFKFYKGLIYFNKAEFNRSKKTFENILFNKSKLIAEKSLDFLEFQPLKYLGAIYEKEKELHKAAESYSKALSINETDDELWINLIHLLGKHSTLEELAEFLNNNVVNKKSMTPQRVINILLSVPLLNVQKLSRSLLDQEELSKVENEALLLKNLWLDRQNDEVTSILNNKDMSEIISILDTGAFSIVDLIMFTLHTENNRYKELLFNMNVNHSLEGLLKTLFHQRKGSIKLSPLEENFFIAIFKQADTLELNDILDILNRRRYLLSKNNKGRINELKSAN